MPSITTKSLSKLKIIIIQERAFCLIQKVAFAGDNFYQQQHSNVITPIKRLTSTKKSITKAALLFTYQNAISAKFNTLANQIYHSTLSSITTDKISKIPMQYQLTNFLLTIIIAPFCLWSKRTDVNRKITSNILIYIS